MSIYRFLRMLEVAGWMIIGMMLAAAGGGGRKMIRRFRRWRR